MIGLAIVKLFVERAMAAEDAFEDVGGDATGGEARHFRLGRDVGTAHCRFISIGNSRKGKSGRMEPQIAG